jgi:type II secretory ATPase GspE/PulE/Tfp pilus assembly ATPase PilB-like protein
MLHALSERLGIPFIDLDRFRINPESVRHVPEDLVRKHRLIPVHHFGKKLVVALENPMDWEALDAVRFQSKLHVEQVMASRDAIERMIANLYSGPDLTASLQDEADGEDNDDRGVDYDESAVQDNVIVKLVNKIIIDAYQQRASDVHIEPYPGKNKTVVRIRKDGSLKAYYEIPGKMRAAVVARIKVMADLDISERRKPQDGKIDFKKFGPLKIELRVATIPTANDMEDVVMRLLASGEPVPLDKLNLSARNAELLRRQISKPYGLFFVCGPTGSGKTTTLHSVLGHLNTSDRKIWTAEDPVEITQRGLRQVEVKPKIGFNFAAAMRAFLRADPDIIMVGEMRDKETTSMGIEASLTGHLVLSTLHTNSAPETVTRLLDMGMDPFNFADALIGILAQRLAKRLCVSCKEAYEPSDDELNELVAEYCYELLPKTAPAEERKALHDRVLQEWRESFTGEDGRFTLYRPKGCRSCDDTGYSGRLGIHELLPASDNVKKKILENATVSELLELAISEGMRTLKQDGLEKVMQGLTDAHTVRTVCIK